MQIPFIILNIGIYKLTLFFQTQFYKHMFAKIIHKKIYNIVIRVGKLHF